MRAEIKFSSKRFLMSLTLCACSVILLQSFDLAPASFLFDLLCVGVGLGLCFLLFLPTALLKKRCGGDTLSQLGSRSAAESICNISLKARTSFRISACRTASQRRGARYAPASAGRARSRNC